MELLAEQRRDFRGLLDYVEEQMSEIRREWDAGERELRDELNLISSVRQD